jgi:hypothetical protein
LGSEKVKKKSMFSPKIMACGAIKVTRLSQLHVLPQKQNVTGRIYKDDILNPFLLSNVNKTSDTNPVTDRRFHENTLGFIFQQD